MKKLLILMLVLGLTSMASAALQISVNGEKNPEDSQINIYASDHLSLDIWTNAAIDFGVYFGLVAQTKDGVIIANDWFAVSPYDGTDYSMTVYDDAAGNGVPGMLDGENGVWGGVFTFSPVIPAGAVVIDHIDFHCEWAPNDVIIHLYETDWETSQLVDTVIIHQIPEPATMLLLGLGGLLLRRRK